VLPGLKSGRALVKEEEELKDETQDAIAFLGKM
jgi:hypothetical protein